MNVFILGYMHVYTSIVPSASDKCGKCVNVHCVLFNNSSIISSMPNQWKLIIDKNQFLSTMHIIV